MSCVGRLCKDYLYLYNSLPQIPTPPLIMAVNIGEAVGFPLPSKPPWCWWRCASLQGGPGDCHLTAWAGGCRRWAWWWEPRVLVQCPCPWLVRWWDHIGEVSTILGSFSATAPWSLQPRNDARHTTPDLLPAPTTNHIIWNIKYRSFSNLDTLSWRIIQLIICYTRYLLFYTIIYFLMRSCV